MLLRKYRALRRLMVFVVSAAVVFNFAAHDVWAIFPDVTALQFYTYGIVEAKGVMPIVVPLDVPGGDVLVPEEEVPMSTEIPVSILVANQLARQYATEEYDAIVKDFAWTIMGENQNELIEAMLAGDTGRFNTVVDSVAWVVMNRVRANEAHMGGGTIEGVLSHTNAAGVPAFSCRWEKFGDPAEPGKFNIYHYKQSFSLGEVDAVFDAIRVDLPEKLHLRKIQILTRIEVIKRIRHRLENDILQGRTEDPTGGAKFYISSAMLTEIDRGERPLPAHIRNLRRKGLDEIPIPGTRHIFFSEETRLGTEGILSAAFSVNPLDTQNTTC